MDYFNLVGGAYESSIFQHIKAHAHFVIILSPSALQRCSNPNDLMRREIESALQNKRNIVGLMLDGFDFKDPSVAEVLVGSLAPLPLYQAISLPNEYFFDAMEKLRNRHLSMPLAAVIHPMDNYARHYANELSQTMRNSIDTATQRGNSGQRKGSKPERRKVENPRKHQKGGSE